MDECQYDFHHCDTHCESYPFESSLLKIPNLTIINIR